MRNRELLTAFLLLGQTFPPSTELIAQLNKFVCLLYGDKDSDNVNKCRFALFKKGKSSDDALPPTCDSLAQHIRRANFQAAIWRRCLEVQISIPPATENGWKLIDDQLCVVWMTIPPAPDSLLECVHCACKTGCGTQRCSCKRASLRCTDVCSCADCVNADDGLQNTEGEEETGYESNEEEQENELEADLMFC